jgi:tetratricopeptide (TPR) repeat protein
MDSRSKRAEELLRRGIDLTHARQFGEAGELFFQSLQLIEAQPSGLARSQLLGSAAHTFQAAGHPDLGLMAVRALLESPERRQDPGSHCADLLTLANSWSQLGRESASYAANEMALDHAIAHHRYADAASASTNLAGRDANSGNLPKALQRLRRSLEFLAKEPFPETDAITRLTLLQVANLMDVDPTFALEASKDLFSRLESHVGPERWNSGPADAFQGLVARYLAQHPKLDADTWKRTNFPLVFGGSRA